MTEFVRSVNVHNSKTGQIESWQAPVLTATRMILETLHEEFNRRMVIVERKINRLPKLDKSPKAQMWRNMIAQQVQKLELLAGAIDREMEWIEKFGL